MWLRDLCCRSEQRLGRPQPSASPHAAPGPDFTPSCKEWRVREDPAVCSEWTPGPPPCHVRLLEQALGPFQITPIPTSSHAGCEETARPAGIHGHIHCHPSCGAMKAGILEGRDCQVAERVSSQIALFSLLGLGWNRFCYMQEKSNLSDSWPARQASASKAPGAEKAIPFAGGGCPRGPRIHARVTALGAEGGQ